MDTNQAIRLQCLELAVKAGTPWNRLTDTADMLTAYVRGVNARVATDQIDSLTPAGLAEYRRTGELSTDTAISPADKGVAVEESLYSASGRRIEPQVPGRDPTLPEYSARGVTTNVSVDDIQRLRSQVFQQMKADRIVSAFPPGPVELEPDAAAYVALSDRGVPVEDSPTWPTDMPQDVIEQREALLRNGDFGKTAMLGSALRATLPENQGGEPIEEPPPGVANDPRLPMVTM